MTARSGIDLALNISRLNLVQTIDTMHIGDALPTSIYEKRLIVIAVADVDGPSGAPGPPTAGVSRRNPGAPPPARSRAGLS
jgi:hypothetical protein